ncbi:HEAT repeat domain-containing protein [Bremerella sp. JC770]|uniref:HEAT repeat domain-containing protein n=1 Tax=Bremerella sp. JC770 TaxID=3232137 RepID=UPI0034581506
MFSSPLRRAIKRGLKPGGDLVEELRGLDDYVVSSKKDALAICQALETLPGDRTSNTRHFSTPLHELTGLFQDVDGRGCPAFEVLYEEGLPELARIFDEMVEDASEEEVDDLLYVLKILAMYGSFEGAQKIVEAAQIPMKPDAYMWHVILSTFSEEHPQREFVMQALSDPLPTGFLAIGLLDSANGAAINGVFDDHPFDSPDGAKVLEKWLQDPDPENFSYAHSATAALPFISNPARDQLLTLAMEHPDTGVQIEAAWAAGKLGREEGLSALAQFCLDVNQSETAQRYLEELERGDLIPTEAQDDSFRAKAEFSSWLAHPNELGKAPDSLEIVDHRELDWPPEREPRPMWLIRYVLRDDTGLEDDSIDCGLVGSLTWCFFTYKMDQRPPEDVYAIHCYWEMQHAELIEETEVTDPKEYAGMLSQWSGDPLTSPTIIKVAEISPKLNTSARFVALATAKLGEQDGWVVLDGPRSAWYPQAEQPSDTHDSAILKIHVGRQLLGFEESPDRKSFLHDETPSRTPEQYFAAYEKLLEEASDANSPQQKKLLSNHSLLASHFDRYIDMLVDVKQMDRSDAVIGTYGRVLAAVQEAGEELQEEAFDSFGMIGGGFEAYVEALKAKSREEEIAALVILFQPHWQHNLGYGKLGSAAYLAGRSDLAEPYFLKIRDGMESYHRCEEMSMLAEILHGRGETTEAHDLLIECLQETRQDFQESEFLSDRQMFAESYQGHRETFLRLFPDGEAELVQKKLPTELS